MCIEYEAELLALREVGRVVAECLRQLEASARAGITTAELDAVGAAVLDREGARPAPALVYGFPAAICISVNDEVVHGIPSGRALRDGDLLKLDVTAEKDGFMADAAITVGVGALAPERKALLECARRAFHAALPFARTGRPVRRLGRAIADEVRRAGFAVARELSGHGIGRTIHEPPTVPNFDDPEATEIFGRAQVVTVEPIITAGSGSTYLAADRWTVRTTDGSVSAHYEHTIVVTDGAPLLLTAA